MKIKSFIIFSLMLLFTATCALAETRAYSYEYTVKDGGIKYQDFTPGKIWYFTFNGDKSHVYCSDKNGIVSPNSSYFQYSGTENGILVYVFVQSGNSMIKLPDIMGKLYFSSDFSRMNWDCPGDGNRKSADGTIVRVYNYKADPDKQSIPSQLY